MINDARTARHRGLRLTELIRALTSLEIAGSPGSAESVTMVTSDSREVVAGALFVAVRGYAADGHRFIAKAVENGAAAVICEELPQLLADSCLYVKVADARQALAEAAKVFYGNASDRLLVIGVTGTNGKTTTARLITAMLNANGIAAGYIGTNLCLIGDRRIPLERTTPEAHGLHSLFSEMLDGGCRAVVMEVSSHALVLKRVYGIRFHALLFTNLTMEHLDFHRTMEEYATAKQQLFDQLGAEGFAVFNTDDPYASLMMERVPPERRICCAMLTRHEEPHACARHFQAELLRASIDSTDVVMRFPEGPVTMQIGLPGLFNIMNVLEAAAVGAGMGFAPETICRTLAALSSVEGRMERVCGDIAGFHLFVDYAHTPDALQKALSALRDLRGEGARLLVVFGCGGNRDRGKRPEMGRIASEIADEVIITSDNPRDEDPEAILDEIERGITTTHCRRISDRAEALRSAVRLLREGDILLVAGKGHEKYQEIAGVKQFFSDQELLETSMKELHALSSEKECGI